MAHSLDVDTLIACVRARSSIWDKREKSHSNRVQVDRCWKEIAKKLGIDESALRKKWKYLREQFCVELGKIPQPFDGEEESYMDLTKWPYFKPLIFLKDVVKPRLSSSASCNNVLMTVPVDPSDFAEEQIGEESLSDSFFENHSLRVDQPDVVVDYSNVVDSSSPAPPSEVPLFLNSRKRYYPSEDEGLFECEQKRLNVTPSESKVEDEDLMFFKSLLPHVRRVSPADKLMLRTKILEVVSKFAYPIVRTSDSNCTSTHSAMNHSRKMKNITSATSESD